MRTTVILLVLAASAFADVFNGEKVRVGRGTCTCTFSLVADGTKLSPKSKAKCDKKCNGAATKVSLEGESGVFTFDMKVKKGKVALSKGSVVIATTTKTIETTSQTTEKTVTTGDSTTGDSTTGDSTTGDASTGVSTTGGEGPTRPLSGSEPEPEPTGSGSGQAPVPMGSGPVTEAIGSGSDPGPKPTGSGSGPRPTESGSGPRPTGSGSGPPTSVTGPGSGQGPKDGMQCTCRCDCPDGRGQCDCNCNCPMQSMAMMCAPGFTRVCPMMEEGCPPETEKVCPRGMEDKKPKGQSRMDGGSSGCQCVPDFLMSLMKEVDVEADVEPDVEADVEADVKELANRAAPDIFKNEKIKMGKSTCTCTLTLLVDGTKLSKKSKAVCDKKCSGAAKNVVLTGRSGIVYTLDVVSKKGKAKVKGTIKLATTTTPKPPKPTRPAGTAKPTGPGSGSGTFPGGAGEQEKGPICSCVATKTGGSAEPTGPGSETGSGTGPGSEPGSEQGSEPGTGPEPGSGSETGSEPEPSGSGDLFGGSPLTSSNPPWPYADHKIHPTGLYATGVPYPTNVWWQNMVLEQGELVNAVNPYIVKTMSDGLHVCLPTKFSAANYVAVTFHDNVIMSAKENIGNHQVTKYDELSVTVTWMPSGGIFKAPVVRGMPYATVFYENLTPSIRFGGAVLSPSGQVSGTRFEVTLNNGQKWIIYASSQISFNINGPNVEASRLFSGSIRVAGLWDGGNANVSALDECSGKIPTGGSISAEVQGDMAYMKFNWETTGSGKLMMMALPHHLDTLTNTQTSHQLEVLKGMMVGITGDVWTFNENLTPITWGAPRTIPSDKVEDIKAALQEDIPNVECCGDDPYFGGKQMAVLARLALIADEIGESGLAQQARDRVKPFIEGWLGGTNGNTLLYDQTWGGVVSTCGRNDQHCDFGNGMYNDHHFHYGYHIYTAAVLAKADASWGDQWNDRVLHMISDVAEPSRASSFYPFTRTKDWYDGHAWASGIFMFGDGKNQESTSESVNGWYAIYLYGLVMGNTRLKDVGRLMTALEIRAAHRYWQMTDAESIYPKPFADHKAVGILWSTKVDYATWFGANVEFIHCIQMLPFTPISEELLREEWIKEEYDVLAEAYERTNPPLSEEWKGYIIMAHAVIDPHAAYGEALQLPKYDDGNTKSNTLYWIATRPGMSGGKPRPTTATTHRPTNHPSNTTTSTTPSTITNNPPSGGCCDHHSSSNTDDQCNDPTTDAHGGLGCNACGIQNCRVCGIAGYPPCHGSQGSTSKTTTRSTTTSQKPNARGCCDDNSKTDDHCNDPGSDPHGGLGCNACGIQDCRVCGVGIYPAC